MSLKPFSEKRFSLYYFPARCPTRRRKEKWPWMNTTTTARRRRARTAETAPTRPERRRARAKTLWRERRANALSLTASPRSLDGRPRSHAHPGVQRSSRSSFTTRWWRQRRVPALCAILRSTSRAWVEAITSWPDATNIRVRLRRKHKY